MLDERVTQLGLAALPKEPAPSELLYTCDEDDENINETDPGEAIHAHLASIIAGGESLPKEITLYGYVEDRSEHAYSGGEGDPVRLVFTQLIDVSEWSGRHAPEFVGRIESE